jgi:hypothetical protein
MLVLLLVMLLSIMATPVLAVQPKDVVSFNTSTIITPFWENTASAQANISSSNQTLKPSTYILAKNPSTSISGTLYLERKSGSNWQHVTSWPISGTGSLTASKLYGGTAGTTYRARVVVSVGGERVECTSSEIKA